MRKQTKHNHYILCWLCILLIFIPACENQLHLPVTPTVVIPATPTLEPTTTPTPQPLGSAGNPLIWGYVAPEPSEQAYLDSFEDLTLEISVRSGVMMITRRFSNHTDLIQAMKKGEVHAAWLSPLAYLYAHEQNAADVLLLTNHFGTYYIGTQFLANVDSGFNFYYDPIAKKNTAEITDALAQFSGKRPCLVEPSSSSGYIFPLGLLLQNNISTLPPAVVQTNTGVIRALYIKGICDFGATFSISGDPRTSSAILNDLPDARERVAVVWQSEALIPNMNVSVAAGLSDDLRNVISTILFDLTATPEGKNLLALSAGSYDIQEFKAVDDSIYDPLRNAVFLVGTPLKDYLDIQ